MCILSTYIPECIDGVTFVKLGWLIYDDDDDDDDDDDLDNNSNNSNNNNNNNDNYINNNFAEVSGFI